MHSIKRRLIYMFIFCSIITALSSTFFVNLAINNSINQYLSDNHKSRNERIVKYFEEVFKREQKWDQNSGKEMQHEGYMSNYCLTLFDENNNEIWAMDPNEIKAMNDENGVTGEYKTETFKIKYNNKTVGYISIGQYHSILITDQDKNFINNINRNIAISVIIAIVVSVLFSFYFSKQFSNPIKSVADASMQLTGGNYNAVVPTKSKVYEINNLINSINILGNRLSYQDDLRKQLVSDISHEIRTPLNIFQNNLEAMVDGIIPVTPERLNSLNDEVIRFGKLLNNLEILKKFEEEKTEMEFDKVSIFEVVSSVYHDFLSLANKKNVNMEIFVKPGGRYEVLGNKDNLKQVFINLISNAVKFNKVNGKVEIHLNYDKDYIYVSVKDTGIGIKEEDLPFIFERLYRGDKSRNEIEGSGIGLTVVKKIMILHSATIQVESKEQIGTEFELCFEKYGHK